jgi:hypothetical protein
VRTDRMTKLIVAFHSFGNRPKNETPLVCVTNRSVRRNIVRDIETKRREGTTVINFSRSKGQERFAYIRKDGTNVAK